MEQNKEVMYMSNYLTLKTFEDKDVVAIFKGKQCVFASKDYIGYIVGNYYGLDTKTMPMVYKFKAKDDLRLGLERVQVGFVHSEPEDKLLAALTPISRGE